MINIEDIKKTAKLAKLHFSDQHMADMLVKLNNIMEMIDSQFAEIDCSNIEPLRSVCEMDQRLREDEITVQNISSELFNNVPKRGEHIAKEVKCFVVPKVVE